MLKHLYVTANIFNESGCIKIYLSYNISENGFKKNIEEELYVTVDEKVS